METLDLTEEQAKELLADDERIDKGERLFELTKEQEQASKQARKTGTRKATPTERTRKVDADKRFLIDLLAKAIGEGAEITNPEREITFTHNERKFKVVLSAPRS